MADGTIAQKPLASAQAAAPERSSMQALLRRKSTIAFIMTIPLLIIILGLVVWPSLYSIYLSMLNKRMTKFVGIDNFLFLLKRETFQMVIFQSVFFAVTARLDSAAIARMTDPAAYLGASSAFIDRVCAAAVMIR